MSGPMVYGLILGGLISLSIFVGLSGAFAVFWGLIVLQNVIGAVIAWRRTRLPYWTAGLVIAAAGAGTFAMFAARGWRFPFVPLGWNVVVGTLLAAMFFCMWAEKRVHPRDWAEFKAFMKKKSAWDMVLFRHIPVLREGK